MEDEAATFVSGFSRAGSIKLVTGFLVSPFGAHPVQHNPWIRRSTSGERCFAVPNEAGGECRGGEGRCASGRLECSWREQDITGVNI